MKKFILATTALVGLTFTAAAADLPSRRGPVVAPAVVPVFTWTGFYVGVQAGYGWGETDAAGITAGIPVGALSYDIDGFVGGGHVGANYQIGQFVVGVEGDIEFSDQSGGLFDPLTGDTIASDIDWQGSVRARLGFAFDRALVYVTGGVAFADIGYGAFDGATGASITTSDTSTGYTVGAGLEYAFTNNLTARVEYRYTEFDDQTIVITPVDSVRFESETHTIRAGVSYKFSTF